MPLQLSDGSGSCVSLTSPNLTSSPDGFALSGGSEVAVCIKYPPPFQDGVSYGDYLVYAFAKSDYSENDIFDVYEKTQDGDKRIGMIFPLQAAISRDHKKADDIHFLRFSQGAFMALCNGLNDAYIKRPDATKAEFSIFDFYSQNTVIAAIHRPALGSTANEFDIRDYLASFMRYGFYLQNPNSNPDSIANESSKMFESIRARVNIERMSNELRGMEFIIELMVNLMPFADNYLLRFFYLYQVVELLIGILLDKSYEEYKKELSAMAGGASQIRELLDGLQEQLSEKRRISRLFSDCLKPSIDLAELRRLCNSFLGPLGYITKAAEEERGVADFLYPVRNTLFHNLRSVRGKNMEDFEQIVPAMRTVICDALIRFSTI